MRPSVRLEWGEHGVRALGAQCDALVLVDVLSFCTAVDVAVSRGAEVIPCRWRDARAIGLAREHDALLAAERGAAPGAPSLSPPTLAGLARGARLVLPSPNGATLALLAQEAGAPLVMAGCLRNARAVAERAAREGGRVGIVAAGERWPDGALRPAVEDLLGAGAIVRNLPPSLPRTPEAGAAAAAFEAAAPRLRETLLACATGQELAGMGHPQDVEWAAMLDASRAAPALAAGRFVDAAAR